MNPTIRDRIANQLIQYDNTITRKLAFFIVTPKYLAYMLST